MYGASSRRNLTPRSTFWPPIGSRSNEYHSHNSGFTALEFLGVALGVILGLERHVARVERTEGKARGERQRRILDGRLPVRRVVWVRELGQRPPAEQRAVAPRIGQRGPELLEPGIGELGVVARGHRTERAQDHVKSESAWVSGSLTCSAPPGQGARRAAARLFTRARSRSIWGSICPQASLRAVSYETVSGCCTSS